MKLEQIQLAIFGVTSLNSTLSQDEKDALWAVYNEVKEWRENVQYMLDNEPLAVRVHEGGAAQEDLIASLAITFLKLQNVRNQTK